MISLTRMIPLFGIISTLLSDGTEGEFLKKKNEEDLLSHYIELGKISDQIAEDCDKHTCKEKICNCCPGYGVRAGNFMSRDTCRRCNCGQLFSCSYTNWDTKTCYCDIGYTDVSGTCIADCKENPCENRGTCTVENNKVFCVCREPYAGKLCDKIIFTTNVITNPKDTTTETTEETTDLVTDDNILTATETFENVTSNGTLRTTESFENMTSDSITETDKTEAVSTTNVITNPEDTRTETTEETTDFGTEDDILTTTEIFENVTSTETLTTTESFENMTSDSITDTGKTEAVNITSSTTAIDETTPTCETTTTIISVSKWTKTALIALTCIVVLLILVLAYMVYRSKINR